MGNETTWTAESYHRYEHKIAEQLRSMSWFERRDVPRRREWTINEKVDLVSYGWGDLIEGYEYDWRTT